MLPSLYQCSQSGNPPLRIGLLLDTAELQACFAEVLDHILQSNFARLELLVFNADAQRQAVQPPPPRSILTKIIATLRNRRLRQRVLFTLYQRWDARQSSLSHDPLATVDCSAIFRNVDTLSVTPFSKGFAHRFPAEAVERIRRSKLDVLIRFGFNILKGDILTAAKYGIWSYHHGDNDYYRGGPPYFWEIYEANPISGAILQVLTEQLDAGKVLYKGLFATFPGTSQLRNSLQPYWGSVTFMIQKLRELHQYGWEHLERTAVTPAPYQGKKRIYTAPTNWEMLRWLAPVILRKSVRRVKRRRAVRHWRLAMRAGTEPAVLSGSNPDMSGFRWIDSPKGRFYADPFLIAVEGKPWLFFEDFDYAKGRARISCAEVKGGSIADPIPVIERPYHMSYPCVFHDNGALYMIPETGSNNTVELYRCERFPDAWVMERELFKAKAVDTTPWIAGGLYWFFATLKEPRGLATQLWLFSADSLAGDWVPHPANPLSTDVRNCRGAGAISRYEGRLFRPSQNCSREYGYSFTLNEITVFDRERYQETPRATVDPSWSPRLLATHTYAHGCGLEVVDGCALVPARSVLDTNRSLTVTAP